MLMFLDNCNPQKNQRFLANSWEAFQIVANASTFSKTKLDTAFKVDETASCC